MSLGKKQLELVRLVWEFRRDHGRPATMRELAEALGVNHVSVWERIQALVKKGALLRRRSGGRYAYEVPGPVGEELGLLEARHDRIRARVVAVACSVRCLDEPCCREFLGRIVHALRRMDFAETL